MALFQKSVISRHLKNLDEDKVSLAFVKFQKFYGDRERLHNIMQLKEENYQEGFLREIFVQVLGYTINPDNDYNLTTEFKNQNDTRKADGAILKNGGAIGIIELKSTKTKDLESIKEQAFGYKVNQPNCKYVITSNFQSIRFYIDNATEYEEFNLFDLSKEQFKIFYLILCKESVLNHLPGKLKEETKFHDELITQKLYKDYQAFKNRIFEFLCSGNPQYDKLSLFKKSQKLLDRFLFILFAEDCGLIPPNAISKIIDQWKQYKELDDYKTLYSRFQLFFKHLDKGHIYTQWGEIPAYNGGLFRYDDILDSPDLKLPDGLLLNNTMALSAYDFASEVDVNILGHIFEHSLSEIEELTAQLQCEIIDPAKSKRKKDGIFYTPKYITKYIVENTVGTLCDEKKKELQIKGLLIDDTYYVKTHGRASQQKLNQKAKDLFETLHNYKNWLLTLKILDPACGSGAFLNATLDFLIAEHQQIDNIISELTGDKMRMFDTDKQILENNIFGVDINEESVEIAKLSLWLRTAQRGRPLSDLSGNIKCGNSLIDDPEVAGEKAFDWEKEFPHIFNPAVKEKVYQKLPESTPDYVKLVKEKSKEAQLKAEQAAILSKEALEISKQVYKYAEKISEVKEPYTSYGINKGGFDVVLGNPPYVLCQPSNTKPEILEFYKTYKVASYKIDLFHLFFEKSIKLLKKNGKLGFITPNTYLTNMYIKPLRKFILNNTSVEKVVNHNEAVFTDASVDVATIILDKSKKENHQIQILETGKDNSNYNHLSYKIQSVWEDDKENTFNTKATFILNLTNTIPLSSICNSYFGIQAYDRKSSISENQLNQDYKPVIDGADIFPFQYAEPCKYFHFIDANIKSGGDFKVYNEERIVIRQIGKLPIVGICKGNIVGSNTLYNINLTNSNFDLKYILSILNSSVIKKYWLSQYSDSKQLFPKIKGYQLKEIPIKSVSKQTQQPFIEKAELMLTLNKALQIEKQNFINSLKEDKGVVKITRAIECFNELEYDAFKKEILKQKVKISLGNENNQWREYFNTTKQKANELQNQINQTDREIDRMVYELYELTEEEIEIVENAAN
jgi:type I restriction-modification system DNA methylase subunit